MLRHGLARFARALSASAAPPPLRMTERCAARLQALVTQRGQPLALRVSVDGGGCSGFQYAFAIEPVAGAPDGQRHERLPAEPGPAEDMVFAEHGAEVRVDPISYAFVKGATVDYVEEMISSSFRIVENPNSEASCGCGTSFTAKMDA
jgi:iron-sulfur cluster assembly accessory protein